jgi:hypothetical protein
VRFFGTGIRRMRNPVGTVTLSCEQCGRLCAHAVTSQRTWITLLYVGVIPLSRQYFTMCSGCNHLAKMDTMQAENLQSPSTGEAT